MTNIPATVMRGKDVRTRKYLGLQLPHGVIRMTHKHAIASWSNESSILVKGPFNADSLRIYSRVSIDLSGSAAHSSL